MTVWDAIIELWPAYGGLLLMIYFFYSEHLLKSKAHSEALIYLKEAKHSYVYGDMCWRMGMPLYSSLGAVLTFRGSQIISNTPQNTLVGLKLVLIGVLCSGSASLLVGVARRKKWGFVVLSILQLNPFCWWYNYKYVKERWEELD